MTLKLSSNITAGELRIGASSDFTCEHRKWSLSAGVEAHCETISEVASVLITACLPP